MISVTTMRFFGAMLGVILLGACQRTPTPPPPQSEQPVATEAERKAASIEAEMNKDASSENVAKPPATSSEPSSLNPPPTQNPPPAPNAPQ